MPAMGELNAIYGNRGVLDTALGKIGGTKLPLHGHWSSSEGFSSTAWEQNFDTGDVNNYGTGYYGRYVRPVLAF